MASPIFCIFTLDNSSADCFFIIRLVLKNNRQVKTLQKDVDALKNEHNL